MASDRRGTKTGRHRGPISFWTDYRWFSDTSLLWCLSSTKNSVHHIQRNEEESLTTINVMNTQFFLTNNIRIIGLISDHKLTWRPHLNKVKMVCQSRIKKIKLFENNTREADTKSFITIYKALILSTVDYGGIIYNSATVEVLRTLDSTT